jgi:hypothetical protein
VSGVGLATGPVDPSPRDTLNGASPPPVWEVSGRETDGAMPEPGERSPGFYVEPNRGWALVYDRNLQSDHCLEPPEWTGRYRTPKKYAWFVVWSCDHSAELTGLRKIGQRRR